MQEFLKTLLIAVITAAVPVLTGYGVALIRKVGANAAANTESITAKTYIGEATEAIAAAVSATNQTYVDALKNAGSFKSNKEAQKEAAEKALTACMASISPAAQAFIEKAYGDVTTYLTTRIEAEVRKQKNEAPLLMGQVLEVAGTGQTVEAESAAEVSAQDAETR